METGLGPASLNNLVGSRVERLSLVFWYLALNVEGSGIVS